MHRIIPVIALALAACEPAEVNINGWDMTEFFPFDGVRSWEFTSTDTTITQRLLATYDGEPITLDDGTRGYEVEYTLACVDPNDTECVETWVRTLTWSTTQTGGVRIHRVQSPDGDTTFEPAVVLAEAEMRVSATVDSGAFSSEFVGIEPCPVVWTDEWDQCIHLSLSGSGDGSEHVVGDYWAVGNYNTVAIGLSADSGDWQLSYATFEAAE